MFIITGSIAYDYLMDFPGDFSDHILPAHTHNINLSFNVSSFTKRRGGTAGNLSYTLGLLKTSHKLFSVVGSDFAEYKKAFEEIGIDLTNVTIDETDTTATGFALADHSQNNIWIYYYGAAKKNSELQLKTIASKNDLVVIGPQGTKGSLGFVNQCIDLGLEYLFDPGFILTEVANTDLTYGLTHAQYVIGNEYEIQLMKNRIPTWTDLMQEKTVITTLGEKGAVIEDKKNLITIKPCNTQTVATAAGAGDAWRAGFLAGLDRGFDLQKAGQMGAIAGAYAVEHIGTQEHSFSLETFAKRYSDTYNEILVL